jgi:hypothetical protein
MFMTSIFDVINTINLDVYDVDIRRHKHDQLRWYGMVWYGMVWYGMV